MFLLNDNTLSMKFLQYYIKNNPYLFLSRINCTLFKSNQSTKQI